MRNDICVVLLMQPTIRVWCVCVGAPSGLYYYVCVVGLFVLAGIIIHVGTAHTHLHAGCLCLWLLVYLPLLCHTYAFTNL